MEDPARGDVMPGCGGLRKARFAGPTRGKGKRGGVRVVYLHIPEVDRIDMITIYAKGEKDDLDGNEKKALRVLAVQARAEAVRKTRSRKEQ